MSVPEPSSPVHAAIEAARADERQRCIAFLRREADRRTAISDEESGPEAEMWASDSAAFATAAGLLTVCAAAWAISPGEEEGADVEAQIRADERRRCAALLRDHAAHMRQQRELTAASTASFLANLVDPLGPVMGAPAAGGTT